MAKKLVKRMNLSTPQPKPQKTPTLPARPVRSADPNPDRGEYRKPKGRR